MNDTANELQKNRNLFFLVAGSVFSFLILPALFAPLILLISNATIQLLLQLIVQHGTTLLFIVLFTKKNFTEKSLTAELNLEKSPASTPLNTIKYFALMFLAIVGVNYAVQILIHLLSLDLPDQALKAELYSGSLFHFCVIAASALFLAPLTEELLFRGLLYRAFNTIIGKAGATVLSSLLFALVHMNLLNFLSLFLMGIILQHAVEQTRSLRTAIWMHLLNNLVTVLYILYARLTGTFF